MKKMLVKYNLWLYINKCPWTIGGRHGNLLKETHVSINILPWFFFIRFIPFKISFLTLEACLPDLKVLG